MKQLVQEIANDKEFVVHLFEVGERDHVHCFVSAKPKVSVSYIVKMLKGITARKLFMVYPQLKNQLSKGVLWNHSYYVETIGSVSEENIRKYIEKQEHSY
jgi:putative transposase